ncbi:uncharacterized protein LOC117120122 [Anneissia japonica]|uniref:uncharacterized protein LOC117120122 n=1 Tax=Anneissia japonica TaxID=1529436 RepID=UPI0014256282|nr:uncharacterized protein LOC117120122 [Anneissia japonica]
MRWKTKRTLGLAVTACTLYFCVSVLMQGRKTKLLLVEKNIEMITRNPNRKPVYSYRTDNNVYISNSTIDLGQEMAPDLSELDRRTVIVSGFGQKEIMNGLGMIASIQAHMPNKQIIVYNFGIYQKRLETMKALCNVEVRKLPYNNYPIHVQHHENGAWKFLVIRDLLKEYAAVYFTSPKNRFRAPISLLLPFVKERHGIIGNVDRKNRAVDVTHPSAYHIFNLTHTNFTNTYPNAPILSGNALLLVNNSAIYTTMLQPLRACALSLSCIAPSGSTKHTVKPVGRMHTHRYEMSAFTLLMYKNFGDKWLNDNHMEDTMQRIHHRLFLNSANDHIWAHFCNPPKEEVTDKMKIS